MTDQARCCLGFFAFFLQFAGQRYAVGHANDCSGTRPHRVALRDGIGTRQGRGSRNGRSPLMGGCRSSELAWACAWSLVHNGEQYSKRAEAMSNADCRLWRPVLPAPAPFLGWSGPGWCSVLLTRNCVLYCTQGAAAPAGVPHGARFRSARTTVAKSVKSARRMKRVDHGRSP